MPPASVSETAALYQEALAAFYNALYSTGTIVKAFEETAAHTRALQTHYDTALRASLAQHRSLRYKDFDQMIQTVLATQRQCEAELSLSLHQFLQAQTELSQEVLSELTELPAARQSERQRRAEAVAALTRKFAELHQKRREELLEMLREFKAEQEAFSARLRTCLAAAKQMRLRDLREMFQAFERATAERIAQTQARRREVAEMLQRFKQQRRQTSKE